MGRPKREFPPKPSTDRRGRVRVWWQGQYHSLGTAADEPAWKAEYARLVSLWSGDPTAAKLKPSDFLVLDLCRDYLASADSPLHGTDHRRRVKQAIELLLEHHAGTLVAEFGPNALRTWQKHLCQIPDADSTETTSTRFGRASVVGMVGMIRTIWKWGVSTERIPVEKYQALLTVAGPKHGEARQPRDVEPANPVDVVAALPFLRPPVRALVQLEWATGARPSELTGMKVGDIHRGGRLYLPGVGVQDLDATGVWVYSPAKHKTTGKGKTRFIVFGPAEQQLLAPFIDGHGGSEYVFRPADGLEDLRREQRAERAGRGGGSGGSRKRPASEPKRRPGLRYSRQSYYRAVERACERAGVARWFPYQLRHLAASEIKAMFDVDGVQAVLGHHTRTMSEHYGGRSFAKAAEVARGRTTAG